RKPESQILSPLLGCALERTCPSSMFLHPIVRSRFHSVFFSATATTKIYTLSLHDALPIFVWSRRSTIRSSSNTAPRSSAGSVFEDRKSTRLNSSHVAISYAVFCLKKKKKRGGAKLDSDCAILLVRKCCRPLNLAVFVVIRF